MKKDLCISLVMRNFRSVEYGREDGRDGVIVAGGSGKGAALNQFDQSVFVSDSWNHGVAKWMKGAKNGEVVEGGIGRGTCNERFNQPANVSMDGQGNLYVVDMDNDRGQRFDLS